MVSTWVISCSQAKISDRPVPAKDNAAKGADSKEPQDTEASLDGENEIHQPLDPQNSEPLDPQNTQPVGQAQGKIKVEGPVYLKEHQVLKALPRGKDQLAILCSRSSQDLVRKTFCSGNPPQLTGLKDLQNILGLTFPNTEKGGQSRNGKKGNAAFVLSGHSSSLVMKFTSAINPRAIIFNTPENDDRKNDFVAMGFVRGEPLVELISKDPTTGEIHFFLLEFTPYCENKATGKHCATGELLVPAIERGWQGYTVYEDLDLENTILDCLQCHQPEGPGTAKMLRMQELRNPWNHFFRDNRDGGEALIADFKAAQGTEMPYAGIPGKLLTGSNPALLEDLVRQQDFDDQPNEFSSKRVERELKEDGKSKSWEKLYAKFMEGEAIAPPFREVKITDPAKLQSMTRAYQDFRTGRITARELPDIREVFSEEAKHGTGLVIQPGLPPAEILRAACTTCHNPKLNQNISRAKFTFDMTDMSRAEKDKAIERIQLPRDHVEAMPPVRFRSIAPQDIPRVIEFLKQ